MTAIVVSTGSITTTCPKTTLVTESDAVTIIGSSACTLSCHTPSCYTMNNINVTVSRLELHSFAANNTHTAKFQSIYQAMLRQDASLNVTAICQKEYIPGLSDESSDILKLYDEEYNKDPFSESTIQLGDTLLDAISGERRTIWRDMVQNTNLTMNSKKAWATIRRLGADNVSPPVVTTVTADQIANQLLSNGRRVEHRRPPGEHHKTIVPSNNQPPTEIIKPFSLDELATGLSLLKPGKVAGLDDVLT